jgi:hypothetical protein
MQPRVHALRRDAASNARWIRTQPRMHAVVQVAMRAAMHTLMHSAMHVDASRAFCDSCRHARRNPGRDGRNRQQWPAARTTTKAAAYAATEATTHATTEAATPTATQAATNATTHAVTLAAMQAEQSALVATRQMAHPYNPCVIVSSEHTPWQVPQTRLVKASQLCAEDPLRNAKTGGPAHRHRGRADS